MKLEKCKYIVIAVFGILFGCLQNIVAQTFTTSGNWGATKLTGNRTVTLTGKVTITGAITIPDGYKLTINGSDKMIQRGSDFLGRLFSIEPGGSLEISNATIDGNNNWRNSNDVSVAPTSNGVEATSTMIYMNSSGSIALKNVTLQNGWIKSTNDGTLRSSGTAIYIAGTSDTNQKAILEMDDCVVQKMYCTYGGSGIFVNKTTLGSEFTITNCVFKDNTIWYDEGNAGTSNDGNQGGTLRTQGGTNAVVTISGGRFEGNRSNGQAGGIYWNAGTGSLTIKDNVQFISNIAGTYGGGIMVMTKVALNSATMKGNRATYGGGLAYRPFNSGSSAKSYTTDGTVNGTPFEQLTNADMTLTDKVSFSGNEASYGGGIFIESGNIRFATQYGDEDGEGSGDNAFRDEAASMNLKIDGATISGNSASNGGGIYMQSVQYGPSPVDPNTKSSLQFLSGTIQNNTAANNGGGIYLKGIPISFEGTGSKTVSENKAEKGSGGGIYIDNTVKLLNQDLDVNLSNATITQNEAFIQGGGVYVKGSEDVDAEVNLENIEMTNNTAIDNGGGLYLNGGDLNINGTGNIIKSNTAQNGGGVCLEGGELKIEQCDITENSATNLGGGLFVSNSNSIDISLTGTGLFEHNTAAVAGGGMAMQGPIKLTFSGSLEYNKAGNGGGIYLSNTKNAGRKTQLDFQGGLIRYNEANGSGNTATTGYMHSVSALKGFGGGAFLDSDTELIFTIDEGQSLGFYGNEAVSGADDIFANGDGTSVALPYVTADETHKGMDLEGFDVPVDKRFLFWVKDYVATDLKYSKSPKGIDEENLTDGSNMRYRTAIKKGKVNYWKLEPSTYGGYISLALGYRLLFATIQKSGLAEGESAIFKVYQGEKAAGTPFASVLVIGKEGSELVTKRLALSEGYWTVQETDWSWNYTPEEAVLTQSVEEDAENGNIFKFKNIPKKEVDKNQYDETIKVNMMGTSSSSSSNTD